MIRRRRSGFTLIELLMAVVIVGVLTSLVAPRVVAATREAKSVQVMSDVDLVRDAAYAYNGDTGTWPPAAGAGVVPPGLAKYLPGGFTFVRDGYVLQWMTWSAGLEGARHWWSSPASRSTRRPIWRSRAACSGSSTGRATAWDR